MGQSLTYATFERLRVPRPVDRLDYIAEACRGRSVVDIGGLDETSLQKRDTKHWLHGRLAEVATHVVGIDSSEKVPPEGISTSPRSKIVRGDAMAVASVDVGIVDVIVAGEFIEHVEHPLQFLRNMRSRFPCSELIISTPNGASFSNTVMALISRESQHPDHLHCYTFKTLHTLFSRSGYSEWEIIPYRFYATELLLASSVPVRMVVMAVERVIRAFGWMFPLTSLGYIVWAKP